MPDPEQALAEEKKKGRLLWEWERSAAILLKEEMLDAYGGEQKQEIEAILGIPLEEALDGHNPIYYLLLSCWFDNDPTLLWPPAHRDIFCKDLLDFYVRPMEDFAGHVHIWPKDTFKSTIALGYAQWFLMRQYLVYNQHVTVCITHHKKDFASVNLETLKGRFYAHPWMNSHFPEFCHDKEFGTKTDFDMKVRRTGTSGKFEPSVYACGVGTVVAGWKFDLLLNDDIVQEEHAYSETIRADTRRRYEIGRAMLSPKGGKELNVGHRFHVEDQYGILLESKREDGRPLYTRSVRSAIDDNDNILVPNRYSKAILERLRQEEIARTGSDYLWWAVRQNDPRRAGTVNFDVAWYSYFSMKDRNWDKFIRRTFKALVLDTAHKDEKTKGHGDDTVLQVISFDQKDGVMHKYVCDQMISNSWTIYDAAREAAMMANRWGIQFIFMEEIGQKDSLFVMQREMRNKWKYTGDVFRLKRSFRTKRDRIRALMMEFRAGRIHILDNLPQLGILRSQLEGWTERTEHGDDTVDCLAYTCDDAVMTRFGLMDEGESEETLAQALLSQGDDRASRYSPY